MPAEPKLAALLRKALEWGAMLKTGEVRSQADLVKRTGWSRSRVSQILALRRLAPESQRQVLAVKPQTRSLNEHRLQPVVRARSQAQQLRAFQLMVGASGSPRPLPLEAACRPRASSWRCATIPHHA